MTDKPRPAALNGSGIVKMRVQCEGIDPLGRSEKHRAAKMAGRDIQVPCDCSVTRHLAGFRQLGAYCVSAGVTGLGRNPKARASLAAYKRRMRANHPFINSLAETTPLQADQRFLLRVDRVDHKAVACAKLPSLLECTQTRRPAMLAMGMGTALSINERNPHASLSIPQVRRTACRLYSAVSHAP